VSTQAPKGIRNNEPDSDGMAINNPTRAGVRSIASLNFTAVGPYNATAANPKKNPSVVPSNPLDGVPLTFIRSVRRLIKEIYLKIVFDKSNLTNIISTGKIDAVKHLIMNTIISCRTIISSTKYTLIFTSGDQIHRLFEITKNFLGLK
jgi:hypothetical protein